MKGVSSREKSACYQDRNVGGRSHRGWGRRVGSKLANGELYSMAENCPELWGKQERQSQEQKT